jgi:hypothetical protein
VKLAHGAVPAAPPAVDQQRAFCFNLLQGNMPAQWSRCHGRRARFRSPRA